MAKKKTPYEERSDLEKTQSQWHKLSGLHTRDEWSAAIVRAATAAELAANFAVRTEFNARSELDAEFVDSLLHWANGLAGKLDKLLVPLSKNDQNKLKIMKALSTAAAEINKKRNAIVHQGQFCDEKKTAEIIAKTKDFITTLVQLYEPSFKLKDRKS